MDDDYEMFVGIDWGSESHQVCALDHRGDVLREWSVRHGGAELVGLADQLLELAKGQRIAVAIEVPRGAIVETLLERDVAVFAINPRQLDRFRDRHTVAGAKDDRRDARVLADSVRTDRKSFRRVKVGAPQLVQLRELSRMYEEVRAERIMLANRLREQLHRYFPALLELGGVVDKPWLWALLERASTPALARQLSLAKVRTILKQHHIQKWSAEDVCALLRQEPVHVAPGVMEACSHHVRMLLPRLRLADEQHDELLKQIDAQLETLAAGEPGKAEHRDARILRSLPGVGTVVCATMLAEAWQPLERRDYRELRALCGVAPVTRRSGKQLTVSMRHACSRRLRDAVHFWAGNAMTRDPKAKALYAAQRARGHTHGRALRGLADRLLGVLLAMLRTGTLYDAERRQTRAATSEIFAT